MIRVNVDEVCVLQLPAAVMIRDLGNRHRVEPHVVHDVCCGTEIVLLRNGNELTCQIVVVDFIAL